MEKQAALATPIVLQPLHSLPNRRPAITLAYGDGQTFRYRCEDINLLGSTSLGLPTGRSEWRLNAGAPVKFYVERPVTPADPPHYPWRTRTVAVNRLRDLPGHFNIEIPAACPNLRKGLNQIELEIEGNDGERAHLQAHFHWDPTPVSMPLDLTELGKFASIQEIGQAVDGIWEIDRVNNTIAASEPVSHDALLLLGSPAGSQEATYEVMFTEPFTGTFLGLSDFFVRHDEQSATFGIKPGYSTAGLATLSSAGLAECWMTMGDNTWNKDWSWVRKSSATYLPVEAGIVYAVRHQVIFAEDGTLSRFRVWPVGSREPSHWLSKVDTFSLPAHCLRPTSASFGLFQYGGLKTRWRNIKLRPIEAKITMVDRAEARDLTEAVRRLRYSARTLLNQLNRTSRDVVAVLMALSS